MRQPVAHSNFLPVTAPDLKERLFTSKATLYTLKFEIYGVRVFTAKCAGCGVIYLPDPIAAEGSCLRGCYAESALVDSL